MGWSSLLGWVSPFGLHFMACFLALGLASWPAFLLWALLLGRLSCSGPRFLACFLSWGLACWLAFLLWASPVGLLSCFGPCVSACVLALGIASWPAFLHAAWPSDRLAAEDEVAVRNVELIADVSLHSGLSPCHGPAFDAITAVDSASGTLIGIWHVHWGYQRHVLPSRFRCSPCHSLGKVAG